MKTHVDPRLQEVYEEAWKIINKHKHEPALQIKDIENEMVEIWSVSVHTRSKRRRGQSNKKEHRLEISSYMLDYPKKEIVTTMVHEILHMFKDSRDHGGMWKRRAFIMKRLTGLDIQRTRSIDCEAERAHQRAYEVKVANKPKHQIRCTRCGYIIERQVRSKAIQNPSRYTHTTCGGKFEAVA